MIKIKKKNLVVILIMISFTQGLYSSLKMENNYNCNSTTDCHLLSPVMPSRTTKNRSLMDSPLSQENNKDSSLNKSMNKEKNDNIPHDIECPVCLLEFTNDCLCQCINGHCLHSLCKEQLVNKCCPLCRQQFPNNTLNDLEKEIKALKEVQDWTNDKMITFIHDITQQIIDSKEILNSNRLNDLLFMYIQADDNRWKNMKEKSNKMDLIIKTGYVNLLTIIKTSSIEKKDYWRKKIRYHMIIHSTVKEMKESVKNPDIASKFIYAFSNRLVALYHRIDFDLIYSFVILLKKKITNQLYVESFDELIEIQITYFNLQYLLYRKNYKGQDKIMKDLRSIDDRLKEWKQDYYTYSSAKSMKEIIYAFNQKKHLYSNQENILTIIYLIKYLEKNKLTTDSESFNILMTDFLEADDDLYENSHGESHPLDSEIVELYPVLKKWIIDNQWSKQEQFIQFLSKYSEKFNRRFS